MRPIIPIISDLLDHEFSETIHMSTIHAKYGSNHLDFEIASKSGENKSKPISSCNKFQDTTTEYLAYSDNSINSKQLIISTLFLHASQDNILKMYIPTKERPPQIIF